MDPIASGLTILDTIRKAVKTAKKLYNAPKELDELQAEIDTFTLVLNHACLLRIQRLVEYELLEQGPVGTKARRTAWLRKAVEVHELQENLGDCRMNVILALNCGTAVSQRRSDEAIHELQDVMRQKSADIGQSLRDYGADHRHAHGRLLEKLEVYEQRWRPKERSSRHKGTSMIVLSL